MLPSPIRNMPSACPSAGISCCWRAACTCERASMTFCSVACSNSLYCLHTSTSLGSSSWRCFNSTSIFAHALGNGVFDVDQMVVQGDAVNQQDSDDAEENQYEHVGSLLS